MLKFRSLQEILSIILTGFYRYSLSNIWKHTHLSSYLKVSPISSLFIEYLYQIERYRNFFQKFWKYGVACMYPNKGWLSSFVFQFFKKLWRSKLPSFKEEGLVLTPPREQKFGFYIAKKKSGSFQHLTSWHLLSRRNASQIFFFKENFWGSKFVKKINIIFLIKTFVQEVLIDNMTEILPD